MDTLLQILVIVILTFFEGVFVASEIALVTMRRTRIDQLAEEGDRSAAAGQEAGRPAGPVPRGHPDRPDLPRLPGVGLCGGQPDREPRGSALDQPFLANAAAAAALIVVTLLLSLFTIVFGELVPKSLALAHTEQFALRLSGFIIVLLRVLGPLVAAS